MRQFANKTAVVTGGASGIGFALAKRLAAEGMAVAIADIEERPLHRAADELESSGARVLAVPTDVASESSVTDLAARTLAAFGKVHVVCANAGVVTHGSAWEQSTDDWRWTLGVNLWGVIHLMRAFVPAMIEHGEEGHVVVTSSVAGLAAVSSSSYSASKYAVLGMAEGMARELAETPIGVTVLCPGGVNTSIFNSDRNRPAGLQETGLLGSETKRQIAALTAPDRIDRATPDYIASLVLEAIRDGTLYLLPMQPHFKDVVQRRLGSIGSALRTSPDTGVV